MTKAGRGQPGVLSNVKELVYTQAVCGSHEHSTRKRLGRSLEEPRFRQASDALVP